MNKRFAAWLAAGLLASLTPAVASATVIGLPSGTGQGTPGTADPNFNLFSAPLLTPAEMALGAVIIDPTLIPGSWVAPGSANDWIGVIDDDARTGPGIPNDPSSESWDDAYVFRAEFEIVGDPSSTVIQGTWATDNFGQIWVNGSFSGFEKGLEGFLALSSFVLTEDFVEGTNFIDFKVLNVPNMPGTGNPTGLLVEQMGTVPEPATVLLLSVGLGALALRRRRRID